MKTKIQEFEVLIPNLAGDGIAERVKIPVTLEWDEEVKQWLLTPEAHEIIENTKARRIGLLLPAQFRELRERYGYTQKQMGELFQVGEKSWTRWESGKHRPSRSISLLIRALYEGEISINYLLKRAGKPTQKEPEVALHFFTTLCEAWQEPAAEWSSPLAQYLAAGPKQVQVQASSGKGKSAMLAKLLESIHEDPDFAQPSEQFPASRLRYGLAAPSHTYPQPKLTPTEA